MSAKCPICGAESSSAEAAYCERCGASLAARKGEKVKLTKEQKKFLKERAKEEKQARQKRGLSLAERIREEQKLQEARVESQRRARRAAKTVQDAVGFDRLYDDGTLLVEEGLYAQTIYVPDINFKAARPDEQDDIWQKMCSFYNSFPADVDVQLTIMNRVANAEGRLAEISLPKVGRPREDKLVKEYNAMLATQLSKVGKNEIVRERYFTISTPAPDIDQARITLATLMSTALDQLDSLGCRAKKLGAQEYLELLGACLRPDDGAAYDYRSIVEAGLDPKDAVCPSGLDFTPDGSTGKNDCWRTGAAPKLDAEGRLSGELWFQTLQFREPFPAAMDPSVISAVVSLPYSMVLTIHVHPVEQAKAISDVTKKLTFMKSQEAHEGRIAAQQGLDPVLARSIPLTENLAEGADTFDALTKRNERWFSTTIMVTLWDRDRQALSENAFRVAQEASKRLFSLATPKYQMRDAMNTMLPIANDYLAWHRKLLTTELATFMPFVTQEISDPGGIYYGTNTLSGNLILLARKRLTSPAGWIMAKPGSGKSFKAKLEIFATAIAEPDHKILIIDPKGEYAWITQMLGGTVIDLSAGSKDHINLFDMNASYSPDGADPVIYKAEFVTATLSTLLGERAVTPRAKSVIDKAVADAFRYMRERGGGMPTLALFWGILKEYTDDPTAQSLADDLEIYVKGSLRTFAYPTNVDLSARIIDVNMKRLQSQLMLFGQLVTLDAFWNLTTKNSDENKRTWIYIDEAQNFFKSEHALAYFTKFWSEGRSYGLIPTGITQNVDRVLVNDEARHMFSNSDFVMLLNQAPNDLAVIQELYNLSEKQADKLTNAPVGQGLLIAGSAVVPFEDEFPRETELYDILDTDPNAAEDKRRLERLAEMEG